MIKADIETDERHYFRIDDDVILHYRVLSDKSDFNKESQHGQQSMDRLTLKTRFDCLSREMQSLHRRVIDSCSPETALYLSAIDKKLNMLSEYFIVSEMDDIDMHPQRVNIGAGGMSFTSTAPIMPGSKLELRLILLPENADIFSYAKVITCTRASDNEIDKNSYVVAVEFERMGDEIRDLISRHVLSREQASICKEPVNNSV